METQEANLYFIPYFERMLTALEQRDVDCYSSTLELLLFHELRRTVDVLLQLGIREVENLLIPNNDDF